MRRWTEKLKYHDLFIKMFSVTLISVTAVALATWFVMLQMSEKVFMDTFSITNGKILSQIQTSVESMNYAVAMTASNVSSSGEIMRFLTMKQFTTVEAMNSHYKVTQEMKKMQSTLASYPISMLIIGQNGNRHSTDTTFWPTDYQHLADDPITIAAIEEPRKLQYHIDKKSVSADN